MILVTLGTQEQSFTRLLEYVEKINTNDEIMVQAGHTKFTSSKLKIIDFISYEEMQKLVDKASLIITHGGTGSVIDPLKKGKIVIACARLQKYGEHVDDHQIELVECFFNNGFILKLDEEVTINEVVQYALKDFKPKKFISNTEKFITQLNKKINE